MPDKPFGSGEHHEHAAPAKTPKDDKRRQQIMVGASIALVLLGYLTYRKMKAGSGGGTVSPATSATGVPVLPLQTGTNIPSGNAAPQTTTPYAAPTDTTGGGSIPVTSGTPTQGAPSSTVPPVSTQPVTPAPAPQPAVPVAPPAKASTGAQSVTPPSGHPAGHPALYAPVTTPHPNGSPALPGQGGFPPIPSTIHPTTAAGTI